MQTTANTHKNIRMKIIALFMVMVLFLPMMPTMNIGATPAVTGFSDLSEAHWAHAEIIDLASRGVINGFPDGTYRPETPVTREQFARLVVGLIETAPTDTEEIFVDVPTSSWSNIWVTAAVRRGIINPDRLLVRKPPYG
jgi:hypothetical protein